MDEIEYPTKKMFEIYLVKSCTEKNFNKIPIEYFGDDKFVRKIMSIYYLNIPFVMDTIKYLNNSTANEIKNIKFEDIESERVLENIDPINLRYQGYSSFYTKNYHHSQVCFEILNKKGIIKAKDCNLLANEFDFTGGQIENIMRKKEIHEIIHGEKATVENLMTFCSEETLVNSKVKIGFSIN